MKNVNVLVNKSTIERLEIVVPLIEKTIDGSLIRENLPAAWATIMGCLHFCIAVSKSPRFEEFDKE